VELARELGDAFHVSGVRLDSGDLVDLAKQSRRILDDAGLRDVGIVVSGGLDEYAVERMLARGAPIASIAVGTNVGVSADAPKVDSAYKLVSYAGTGRMKLSTDKVTLPGAKQVYRRFEGGVAAGDTIGLPGETGLGEPLLVEVMRDGKRLPAGNATLEQSREHARASVAALPERLRWLTPAEPPYEVAVSEALRERASALRDELSR
jgi:nicotinate phosphoribosyltransferase